MLWKLYGYNYTNATFSIYNYPYLYTFGAFIVHKEPMLWLQENNVNENQEKLFLKGQNGANWLLVWIASWVEEILADYCEWIF